MAGQRSIQASKALKDIVISILIFRISSSYEYKVMKPEDKTKKYRNLEGKVITNPPNICANSLAKMQHERGKTFKYVEDPYDNLKKKRK